MLSKFNLGFHTNAKPKGPNTITNAMGNITDMFCPPVNRAMRVLDRSFFNKIIQTSAARVIDRKQILHCRNELGHDVLKINRRQAVNSVRGPDGAEAKAVLLKPEVKSDGEEKFFVRVNDRCLLNLQILQHGVQNYWT